MQKIKIKAQNCSNPHFWDKTLSNFTQATIQIYTSIACMLVRFFLLQFLPWILCLLSKGWVYGCIFEWAMHVKWSLLLTQKNPEICKLISGLCLWQNYWITYCCQYFVSYYHTHSKIELTYQAECSFTKKKLYSFKIYLNNPLNPCCLIIHNIPIIPRNTCKHIFNPLPLPAVDQIIDVFPHNF